MRSHISSKDLTPFFSPKASHASETGRFDACKNVPHPTTKLSGAWSLKRKSSPGCSTLKEVRPDGAQKFTSSGGLDARKSNHLLSVTATKTRTMRRIVQQQHADVQGPNADAKTRSP